MRATWIILAARSRRQWRGWLLLTLLVTIGTGVVLSAVTAGRRADAASPGYVAAHGYDAIVYTLQPLPLATLPEVTEAVAERVPFVGQPACSCGKRINDADFAVREVPPAALPRAVKLVSGRLPDQSDPGEALASYTLARDYGVGPGTVIRMPTPAPSQARQTMQALAGSGPPARGGGLRALRGDRGGKVRRRGAGPRRGGGGHHGVDPPSGRRLVGGGRPRRAHRPHGDGAGTRPAADDEVALGRATLRSTGTHVGGTVQVTVAAPDGAPRTAALRVVGTLPVPADFGTGGLGTGAVLTAGGYLAAQCPASLAAGPLRRCRQQASARPADIVLVHAVPGPAGTAALAQQAATYQGNDNLPAVPTALASFGESANFPLLVAVLPARTAAAAPAGRLLRAE